MITELFFTGASPKKIQFWHADVVNTSDGCEFPDEKVCWRDLPLCREVEDLTEEPDARIGTGDGDTESQGEAAWPVQIQCLLILCPRISKKK